ncbi:MAG: LPS assembly lipoprotein LptE [Gammaproteobacteria bacterium]
MLSKHLTRFGIAVLLTGLLSSCGFHLRETPEFSEKLQATALQGVPEFSELDLAFKRYFSREGYTLIVKENAQAIIKVTKDKFTRRVLSVNINGDPNEYELNYQLKVLLVDINDKEIMPPQSVTQYRSYGFDPDLRLAKGAEEAHLKKTMVDAAVKEIMHRISVVLRK